MSATTDPANTLNPTLGQGVAVVSGEQTVPFVQYVRYVLPLDGYVFWLRAQQTMIAGSLHVSAFEQQSEDESLAVNRVTFTTSTPVDCLNEIAPNTMWVGDWSGLRFAFSSRGPYYENAGLYHYAGEAVYPAMESQLVDVGAQLPRDTLVVSNSLPAWLAIQRYTPIWLTPKNPDVTLYPSFAVPNNLRPPYGSVHIDPAGTQALQATPLLGARSTHSQLTQDRVRVTLYGLTNAEAMDWFDTVNRFSEDTNTLGMMSNPVARDGKRGQVGLNILAMQKFFDFDVSYFQSSMRDVARQLIESATVAVQPRGTL